MTEWDVKPYYSNTRMTKTISLYLTETQTHFTTNFSASYLLFVSYRG